MGVKFSKEMVIAREQIVPLARQKMELTPIQERLLKKIGATAYPFTFHFPDLAPCSVTLQPGDDDQGKPIGVEYAFKAYVGENEEDKGHKRSSVTLIIKKVSYPKISSRFKTKSRVCFCSCNMLQHQEVDVFQVP